MEELIFGILGYINNERKGLIRGSKPDETAECFYCFEVFAPPMKPEALVFDMASKSIFCCTVIIYYCIVLCTKLVCKLFIVGLVVTFFGSHFRMCL